MKVHVIGLPSSGKTTLAAELSARLGAPHHDLDPVAYADERWTLRPKDERDRFVGRILEEPAFITEGHFLAWVTPFFDAVDRIIWLDPPLWVLMWRHVRRFGCRRPLRLMARLRFQILCYRRPMGRSPAGHEADLTRSGIGTALRPWADKVLRVRRATTVEEILEAL
jgi:adenylate kinase family enzyme